MLPLIASFTLHMQMHPAALKCEGSYNCHLYYNKSQSFCSEIQISEFDSEALGELKN